VPYTENEPAQLTSFKTRSMVSTCHLLFGAKRSAATPIWEVMTGLNSLSATSKKASSSLISTRTLLSLIKVKLRSSALLRILMSGSRKQSRMVFRCRCTAFGSTATTLISVLRATYLMLLSRFDRNFPRMLTPSTRSPESASMSRIVSTASYRIEFPTFFDESVFVATCARISLICSLTWTSPRARTRRSCSSLHCRNGSVMPVTSCSGA
jgi:hypothetical protein